MVLLRFLQEIRVRGYFQEQKWLRCITEAHPAWVKAHKDGNPEHPTQPAGSSTGWRVSFPSASAGLTQPWRQLVCLGCLWKLGFLWSQLLLFTQAGRGLVNAVSYRGLYEAILSSLPSCLRSTYALVMKKPLHFLALLFSSDAVSNLIVSDICSYSSLHLIGSIWWAVSLIPTELFGFEKGEQIIYLGERL